MRTSTAWMVVAALFLLPSLTLAETPADNYRTYCMQCHGLKGDGMGANIQDMSVQPLNHSDAKMMSKRSDAQLFKVIKEGGLSINRSALMPPWADSFTDDEINGLVKHLRKLCKCKYAGY